MRKPLKEAEGGKLGEILSSGRAPGAIVRGERSNKKIPMEHRHVVHPLAYQGRNCAEVESAHERVFNKKRKIAKRLEQDGMVNKHSPMRHIGSVPFEEFAATRKMVGDHTGKELTTELKRRGRIWSEPKEG